MADFDPSAVFGAVQTLESGTLDERLALIDGIDLANPITSGLLIRALEDGYPEVRLAALKRLDEADQKPADHLLAKLLCDDDPEIRELAATLENRPKTLNPLEELIPTIEKMADSLGPLGGMLKNMVGGLRDAGASDERTQLMALSRLDPANPTAAVVIQQSLHSDHIAVRLAALRKAARCPSVTVPEELISEFALDPSVEVREAASILIQQGQVGPFDENAFRQQSMQSMMSALAGTAGDLDMSSFGDMFGGTSATGEPPTDQPSGEANGGSPPQAGPDLSSLFGGGGPDLSSLFGGGSPDLSALSDMLGNMDMSKIGQMLGGANIDLGNLEKMFQGSGGMDFSGLSDMLGGNAQPTPPPTPTKPPQVLSGETIPHVVDGWIYVVGEVKARDRLRRYLAKAAGMTDDLPDCVRLAWSTAPSRWALSLLEAPGAEPRWLEHLVEVGLQLEANVIAPAEQARRLSEQVWGAAYADHSLEVPLTLVFHDGMLSRAEWGGPTPGAWSAEDKGISASSNGVYALLLAFLEDPTDDQLIKLAEQVEQLREIVE